MGSGGAAAAAASGGSQYNGGGGPTLEDRVRWAQMAEQRVNTAATISQNIYAVRTKERPTRYCP